MNDRDIALDNIKRVARKLGHLRERFVFLGGSIITLLITDPAAGDVRPTEDVDVVFRSGSLSETYGMDEELTALGFRHSMDPDAPTCRWIVDECVVDVIPVGSGANSYNDLWSPTAIEHSASLEVENGIWIRHVTAPYFVAIKLEAFGDRGAGDYLYSQDIDDIVQVVDARAELTVELQASEPELLTYVAKEFRSLLQMNSFLDSVSAHLYPDAASQAREPFVLDRMAKIAALGSRPA